MVRHWTRGTDTVVESNYFTNHIIGIFQGASMFESMWSSMTSSIQLAEECLKQSSEQISDEQPNPVNGVEEFAKTIDSSMLVFLTTVVILTCSYSQLVTELIWTMNCYISTWWYPTEEALKPDRCCNHDDIVGAIWWNFTAVLCINVISFLIKNGR